MTPDRDVLIEAVAAAWERHVRSLPFDCREYWWESASDYEVAGLAVDAILEGLRREVTP